MDISDILNNLAKQPAEIVNLIISYLPKPFLTVFLDFKSLVPYIIPILRTKVRIQECCFDLKEPISFLNFRWYSVSPVFNLIEELVQTIQKFEFIPREIELVNLSTPMITKYKLYQSGVLVNHELDPLVSKLMQWAVKYEDIFRSVSLIHILDGFMNANIEELVFCIQRGFNIGTIEYLGTIKESIIEMFPPTLESLTLHSYSFKPTKSFDNFQSLKSIKVANAVLNMFYHLPPSIEEVMVSDLRTLTVHNPMDQPGVSLVKLRNLTAGIQVAGEFSLVAKIFPNLESFHIRNSRIDDFDELGLSNDIKVLEIDSSPGLVNCLKIERFTQLKQLAMTNMPFRSNIFEKGVNLSVLTKLSFIQSCDFNRNFKYELDPLKFPETLRSLGLHGHFYINTWTPPQNLQELILRGTYFSNGFTILLPPNLNRLFIVSTNLHDLDHIEFPGGLREFDIRANEWLKSMVDTNLHQLTQLVRFDISFNPCLTKFDEPDRNLRCKRLYNLTSV